MSDFDRSTMAMNEVTSAVHPEGTELVLVELRNPRIRWNVLRIPSTCVGLPVTSGPMSLSCLRGGVATLVVDLRRPRVGHALAKIVKTATIERMLESARYCRTHAAGGGHTTLSRRHRGSRLGSAARLALRG